jgi:DNA repair exonuclease SbcCD nuclease subunit
MERDSLIETFSPFGIVIKDKEIITIDGVDIYLCSYTNDQTLVPTVGADYLFTHLPIADFSFDNGFEVNDKNGFKPELFENYKKVFTGHFHRRQEKHNIEYIGSPYQLNYGEAGDTNKGFVVFEPSTGVEEFIKYESAPRYTVFSYEDIAENGVDKEEVKNSFVKIIVRKKIENFSKLRTVLYKIGAIDVRPEFPKKAEEKEEEKIKLDMNKNLSDMMIDFISSKKFTSGSAELDSNELIKKIKEIQSEL